MKILLLQPPLNPEMIAAGAFALNEPLALEMIAGGIEDDEIELVDLRLEKNLRLETLLAQVKPNLVATTSYTADYHIACKLLKEVKQIAPEVLTVIGGHHATLMPGDFAQEFVDVVVIGEGEITFKELVEAFKKGRSLKEVPGLGIREKGNLFFTPSRPLACLEELPLPKRELTARYRKEYFRGSWKPLASLMTSRGCPFRCDFCAMWKFNQGKYRQRSAEAIVQELTQINEPYIDFVDDNTLHNPQRAEEIYKLIKEAGIKKKYKLYARSDTVVKYPYLIEHWKEIGMELILIGFESFRDEELRKRNKHNTVENNEKAIRILKENEVEIAAYFLIDPEYTREDFLALGDYVEKMELTHPVFTVLTPFPGTELYKKRYHEFITYNYAWFDFFHTILPPKLPLPEFYECLFKLYQRVYSSQSNAPSILSPETIKNFKASLIKGLKLKEA
jgi:radical SAM superfamily enzyme YgiQ (UPF0313 family)